MITLQYLEPASNLTNLNTKTVVDKLRLAHDILPFSHLLIGWSLPPRLLEACRREAERLGLRFLRWQPLLTGDRVLQSVAKYRVMGANGHKVAGHRGLPGFTFACPNNPVVQHGVQNRLAELAKEGLYQGFFLDRMRFPSPSHNPMRDLGCFCEHCQKRAADSRLDLEQVRRTIVTLSKTPEGNLVLVASLLGGDYPTVAAGTASLLQSFLAFRQACVTDFVAQVCAPLHETGMEIGLDCFSPSLTLMVGQDLATLGRHADWVKVMTYTHANGPAGIPFELGGLYNYLLGNTALKPAEVLHTLGDSVGFDLPATAADLKKQGVSSSALEAELSRGLNAASSPLLAGIELVDIPGVAEFQEVQILADLQAVKGVNTAGLALSWDLWHIPIERLALVRQIFPSSNQ